MSYCRDREVDSIEGLKKCNLSVSCPNCSSDIIAEPISTPVEDDGYIYFIAKCPHHRDYERYCKPFFVVYQKLNNYIERRYPYPNSSYSRSTKQFDNFVNIRNAF